MAELIDNPYLAPTDATETHPTISTSVPISAYGYAIVLFFLGAFGCGFVMLAVLSPFLLFEVPVGYLMLLGSASSIACGIYAAIRMYRRLADLHRQKVAWQIEQAERLGEYF